MKKSVISLIVIILVLIIGRVFFIKAIPQGHVGIVYSAFGESRLNLWSKDLNL